MTAYRGRLYSAGNDKVIKVWNVDQLAKGCVDNFCGHTDRVRCRIVAANRVRCRIMTADRVRCRIVTAHRIRQRIVTAHRVKV